MPFNVLQLKKTERDLFVAFKIQDRNQANNGDTPLEQSEAFLIALYMIACVINQCDFKLRIDGDQMSRVKEQFIGAYNDQRGKNIGRTFFHNTVFTFKLDADSGELIIKTMIG